MRMYPHVGTFLVELVCVLNGGHCMAINTKSKMLSKFHAFSF